MRTYVSHLKISKTPIGDTNEFSKNISKNFIKMKKEIYSIFQDRVLAKKEAPAGRRTANKQKKFLKNIGKGDIKRAPQKGRKKNGHGWCLSIGLGKIL